MASLNRGQPPARHTKVVHQGPRCLKAGSKGEVESNCSHDVVSSKPVTGRDMLSSLRLLVVVISVV